jgi:uncharacterized cupredoxin-like copper-binding protein
MQRSHRSIWIMIVAMLGMVLLGACSSGKSGTSIDASLTNYKIILSQDSVSAGDITFHIKNEAPDMKHEFVILKTDQDASQLTLDSDGNVAEDNYDSPGEAELDPGASTDLTVNLAAGHYAIICNQPGHYKLGQFINFTVK